MIILFHQSNLHTLTMPPAKHEGGLPLLAVCIWVSGNLNWCSSKKHDDRIVEMIAALQKIARVILWRFCYISHFVSDSAERKKVKYSLEQPMTAATCTTKKVTSDFLMGWSHSVKGFNVTIKGWILKCVRVWSYDAAWGLVFHKIRHEFSLDWRKQK